MKKLLIILAFFLIAPCAGAISDFNFWEYQYQIAVNPRHDTSFSLQHEAKWEGPLTLEMDLRSGYPLTVSRVEYDGKNVMPYSAILKKDGKYIVTCDPQKMRPGYHLLVVEIGNQFNQKLFITALRIDPELNIAKNTSPKEMKKLLGKLQEQRNKIKTLDSHFTLSLSGEKAEGKFEATGEDMFNYTLASAPSKSSRLIPMQKKGSRLLLSPYHLAYYISYDDLFNHYSWYLFKRIGSKVWAFGRLLHRDLWLPQFVELVADEKRGLPLEFKAYIYNREFAAAAAKLEYNNDGLPIKQTLSRRLPNGEDEVSVLTLTNLEPNKRAPKKRWLLF
ncbi:hypothetical protein HZC35_02895 [Candidatus Saganbacteria bacterium]|nr:hypothetical protein [Candidatus Saganbacteria bacterium]